MSLGSVTNSHRQKKEENLSSLEGSERAVSEQHYTRAHYVDLLKWEYKMSARLIV